MIQEYIDKGLINEQSHPHNPEIKIYNYTQLCQYSKSWDSVTTQCRGLIVNSETNEVLARPFPKFFNYQEHIAYKWSLPSGKPIVTEKLDGSLGILYSVEGLPYIATRGSFTSEQAQWATEWWRNNVGQLPPEGETHLFEIIYPQNKIVVDYDFSGLVHLATIDIETGNQIESNPWPEVVRKAKVIECDNLDTLLKMDEPNSEGFVLYYPESNVRMKIKFPDYVRLHKVVTGLSEKGVWEILKDGKDVSDMVKDVPDELFNWVNSVKFKLLGDYEHIRNECLDVLRECPQGDRKESAAFIKEYSSFPGIVFAMLDGKDYRPLIWNIVKPKGQTVFKKDIDA